MSCSVWSPRSRLASASKLTFKALWCVGVLVFGGATASAGQSFDLEEVAAGVYAAIPRPEVAAGANAAVIVNEDDVVVVDTHMRPSFARDLLNQVRAITSHPVRFVVNTHWHPDHTQGNQAYLGAFPSGSVFLSHRATREDVATLGVERLERDRARLPGEIAQLEAELPALSGPAADRTRRLIAEQRAFLEELRSIELVLPAVTFDRSVTLHRPERKIQVLFFGRGHTRGDAVVYLPQERVAIVGDLVTGGPPFARDGYPFEWVETLSQLAQLEIEVIVPGHGRVRRGAQVIQDRIRFLGDALGIVRRGWVEGKSVAQMAAEIDIDSYRHTFDPEPPGRPWREWMHTLVERAVAELQSKR